MQTPTNEDSFREHLRQAPFTDADRDLLTTAEQWLVHQIITPPVICFQDVFTEITEHDLSIISATAFCTARATSLLQISEAPYMIDVDRKIAAGAMYLYLVEAQRLLGSMFPENHVFWSRFYRRAGSHIHSGISDNRSLKSKYSFYLLPVDVMHSLTSQKYQLEYELLIQSLGCVLVALFEGNDRSDRNAPLMQALRLANRLALPEYDTWITNLSQHIENSQA